MSKGVVGPLADAKPAHVKRQSRVSVKPSPVLHSTYTAFVSTKTESSVTNGLAFIQYPFLDFHHTFQSSSMDLQSPLTQQSRPDYFEPKIVTLYRELFRVGSFSLENEDTSPVLLILTRTSKIMSTLKVSGVNCSC